MFGLNDAGKTSILYKLVTGEAIRFASTTSFNHEIIPYKNLYSHVYDIGWIFYKYKLFNINNYHKIKQKTIQCYVDENGLSAECTFNKIGKEPKIDYMRPKTIKTINFNFCRKSLDDMYDKYDMNQLFKNVNFLIFVIDCNDPYRLNHDYQDDYQINNNYGYRPISNNDCGSSQNDISLFNGYLKNIMKLYNIKIPNEITNICLQYYSVGICVKDLLLEILFADEFNDLPILFYYNKQDLRSALSKTQIEKRLDLNNLLKNRIWAGYSSCGTTGDGLYEGIDWVENVLYKLRKKQKIK